MRQLNVIFFLILRFVQLADVAADKFNLFAHIQLEHSHALTCTRTHTHTRELGVVIKPCANGKRTCNPSIWKRFYNDYGRMTRITWWHKDWSQNQLQIDFSVCVLTKNAVWPRPTSNCASLAHEWFVPKTKKVMDTRGKRGKPGETGYRPLGKLFLFLLLLFSCSPKLVSSYDCKALIVLIKVMCADWQQAACCDTHFVLRIDYAKWWTNYKAAWCDSQLITNVQQSIKSITAQNAIWTLNIFVNIS